MKLLACLLLTRIAAERAGSKAHQKALSSWGHHDSAVPTNRTSPSEAHVEAPAALRKKATVLLAAGEARYGEKFAVRFCNAFAYTTAIDIFHGMPPGHVERLTKGTGPLPYRRCVDLPSVPLESGDRLQFRIGDLHLGTFAVTEVPESSQDIKLLIVFYRNDRMTTAMNFASHAFQDKYQPQLAVIDAYLGSGRSKIEISDRIHAEDISYGNVITIPTGTYEVKLQEPDQVEPDVMHIDARAHETYVVMRTGAKAFEGPSYPEQLVTFPGGWNSKAAVEKLSGVALVATVISLWA